MEMIVLSRWTTLDPIRYLIIATIILGIMLCIKLLMKGK